MDKPPISGASTKYVVHKFGGTSVGSSSAIRQVVDIIDSCPATHLAVVVSGMGGKPKVTDLLLDALALAKNNEKEKYTQVISQLKLKHLEAVNDLLPSEIALGIMDQFETDLDRIREILFAVSIMHSYNQRVMELVCGHGELWSARILTAVLNEKNAAQPFVMMDARQILKVDPDDEQGPAILWEESKRLLDQFMAAERRHRFIITGFIASTKDGVPTTLKRDGSDYSASIFARLLNATEINIWTDVNGVLSADPRRVPESKSLARISYEEAMELAYFGAKVIHPKTMVPAILSSIPIHIRNTFEPQHPGTCIFVKAAAALPATAAKVVSGFSAVDKLALFNLEGSGMVGVLGIASRLFTALEKEKINVVLIAQASSEHSICFAVPIHRAEDAKVALEQAFFREVHVGHIQTIEYIAPISIIAAVGDNMSQTPGVCARFFGAFRRAKINVLAISQGSSERNISAVVHSKDSASALRAAHTAFFLSEQTISIGIVCSGDLLETTTKSQSATQALFAQLKRQHAWLKSRYRVDIRIRAVCDSKRTLLDPIGIDLNHWQDEFKKKASIRSSGSDLSDIFSAASHIKPDHMPHWLLIDLTHDESLVTLYPAWLQDGIHIISANVFAASCSTDQYRKLMQFRCRNKTSLKFEPCIGAGLPLLHMLQNLLQTGDPVQHIDAELSGAMGYVLSRMNRDASKRFSDAARDAMQQLGLCGTSGVSTALEDFSGLTSARKLVAISRELGCEVDIDDIEIDTVITTPVAKPPTSCEELIEFLAQFNDSMRQRVQSARAEQRVLSLMSRVSANGKARVELTQIPTSHPFASLDGPTHAVCFYTERYRQQPLCVHGPAAGPSILAGSVFGTLLSLTRELGASDHGSEEDTATVTSPRNFVLQISPSQSATDLSSLN